MKLLIGSLLVYLWWSTAATGFLHLAAYSYFLGDTHFTAFHPWVIISTILIQLIQAFFCFLFFMIIGYCYAPDFKFDD